MQALVDDLMGLGATVVTTEQELKQAMKDARLKPPLLGLNCVGGSSATALAKALTCAAFACYLLPWRMVLTCR